MTFLCQVCPVSFRYFNLTLHTQTRPAVQLVVCKHILPHSINYNLRVSNRSFTNMLNRKAAGLNSFISDYCMRMPGLSFFKPQFSGVPSQAGPG